MSDALGGPGHPFLVGLGDVLLTVSDARQVMGVAVERLGRHLGAQRVGYGEIQPDDETVVLGSCFADGVTPLEGPFPLDSFGVENIARQRRGLTHACDDVDRDPDQDPRVWASIATRAFASVPLVREGRFVASLYVNFSAPHRWTSVELGLIEEVAARTWAAVERARAEAALRDSEERLRLATENAEIGFWDVDPIHDVLTWPPRVKAMFGISPDAPVTMGDFYDGLHPDDREATSQAYAVACDPTRRGLYDVEYRTVGKEDGLLRWVAAKGRGLFDDAGRCVRVVGTAIDITARKHIEARRLALVQLGDLIRQLTDPEEIAFGVAEILGRTFGVSRAGYGTIDKASETILIERDWNAPGIKSLAGLLHFRDYGSYIEDLKGGRTVAISDARVDPRTAATAPALEAISARSLVNMPVTEQGGFVALLYLNHDGARDWPEDELAFLREVAERTRTATARLTAERELRDSEARLRTLNANLEQQVAERTTARSRTWQLTPDLMGVVNADGCFEQSNPAWASVLGWSEAEVAGAVFFDFIHPDDLPKTRAAWADIIERGEPAIHLENRYRTKRGQWRWLQWVAVPEEGKVYWTARDITLAKQQADDLAERTAERDRVWKNSRDLLVVVDADGVFRAVNPAWTTIFGHTPDEVVGRSFRDFVWPEDAASTQRGLDDAAAAVDLTDFENRYRHRDGSPRWISWRTSLDGDLVYAYGRDVTAEKETAAALERTQEALRQAQKMEAVGQLTGGIAHDFNNMLAVVIGSLDLLSRRIGAADARSKRYVDAATDGARRAANLTQRLLAFSRQQPLNPEPLNVNKLVAGMSDLLRHSLGGAVQLETVLAGGLWQTNADPNQLENLLLNLAVNARDAMPDGGRLTIETQNAHLDARYVAAQLGVQAGQYVLIAVTDTGVGMPQEVIAKAFDPFFTTKEVGKGTGLGLSQVYGFVKQSGGHVRIYSEAGQGTTVKVYLPRLTASAVKSPDEGAHGDLQLGERQEVVLVVEDEASVRQLSTDALTELGYRVLEADGAAAALRLLDTHPEIILMFTDVVMPEVNGAKLAEEARRRRPNLRVLFTTGYTRNAVVHNGVLDAGVQVIGKPFTIEELAAKVREAIDGPPS